MIATTVPRVNLQRLSYVVYQHVDIDDFERFSQDFGFKRIDGSFGDGDILFEGYGPDPYLYVARRAPFGEGKAFVGAGFVARTLEDFENAKSLPGAKVVDISHLPGGGSRVDITDPNGYQVEIVFGQGNRKTPNNGVSNVYEGAPNVNGSMVKPRRGVFNRMTEGPAMVNKLGHFGYLTDRYADTCTWYSTNFNFKATDIVHVVNDPSAEFITFFHIDLGKEYSDHHSLLVAKREAPKSGTSVHHASFEVEDLDSQMMGHQWLDKKGRDLVWGVGRHIMGSQVFDYWRDSSGFIVEHYADSDVVNEDHKTQRVGGLAAAIWGPPMPNVWH